MNDDKPTLRREALAARDALPPAERARLGARIIERLEALPEVMQATSLMTFVSFRSEVATPPFIDWALAHGKSVAVPRVTGPFRLEAFAIHDLDADLARGTFGILEPLDGLRLVDPVSLDAIVVPGAAFGLDGSRCGYGGGFYDSYLPRARRDAARIGLAFDCQVTGSVPCEAHDARVDMIVTESRVARTPAVGRRPRHP